MRVKLGSQDYLVKGQVDSHLLERSIRYAIERKRMQEELLDKERLAALGEAVAGISHYIKNVLTGLRGSVKLIEVALRDRDYEVLEGSTRVLERSCARITHLVRDMLSYSKSRNPEPEETSPEIVILHIYQLMHEAAAEKGIEIILDIDENIPLIWIDSEALDGVILNLVTNAMDAVHEKTLAEDHHEGKIWVKARYFDGNLGITVRDNGSGIPEEEQEKMWTPFYSTKGSSGTGLGLPVSRKVAEESGGSLTFSSTAGEGSAFTVVYPAPAVER